MWTNLQTGWLRKLRRDHMVKMVNITRIAKCRNLKNFCQRQRNRVRNGVFHVIEVSGHDVMMNWIVVLPVDSMFVLLTHLALGYRFCIISRTKIRMSFGIFNQPERCNMSHLHSKIDYSSAIKSRHVLLYFSAGLRPARRCLKVDSAISATAASRRVTSCPWLNMPVQLESVLLLGWPTRARSCLYSLYLTRCVWDRVIKAQFWGLLPRR